MRYSFAILALALAISSSTLAMPLPSDATDSAVATVGQQQTNSNDALSSAVPSSNSNDNSNPLDGMTSNTNSSSIVGSKDDSETDASQSSSSVLGSVDTSNLDSIVKDLASGDVNGVLSGVVHTLSNVADDVLKIVQRVTGISLEDHLKQLLQQGTSAANIQAIVQSIQKLADGLGLSSVDKFLSSQTDGVFPTLSKALNVPNLAQLLEH